MRKDTLPESQDSEPRLYQHALRHDWGLAAVAYERGRSRAYQFEDGEVREFKVGSKLIRRVAATERNRDTVRALRQRLRVLEAKRRQQRTMRRAVRRASHALAPQIRVLEDTYEDGFSGNAWIVKMRGHGAKRRLKRHRTPAVLGAQQRLDQLVLDSLVAKEKWKTVQTLLVEAVESTNLVTKRQLNTVRKMTGSARRELAESLRELLYGDSPFEARFNRFVEACKGPRGKEPPWELVTAPLALIFPEDHVCVHPKTFAIQAQRLEMRHVVSDAPRAAQYRHWLAVAKGVAEACRDHRLRPKDLLDVRDFIQFTLSGPSLARVKRASRTKRGR